MTGALKPYPAYRDSGLPWLGRVPKHWEVRRLKDHGTLISGTGFPHSHQGRDGEALPFYKVGDLASCDDNIHVDAAPNSISYETATHLHATVVPKGAIIYAKIGEALFLNRRRITKTPCCIDNNMTAFVPNNSSLTTKWAFYWTCILDFGSTYNPGAVPFIGERNQAMLPMLIPPLDEQFAIARYLDHVGARVDCYIGAKERLIALLKERKQAIIDRAVTRGLDPNAPMKPTGITWMPEVPAHWEVRALKHWVKGRAEMLEEQTDPDYEFDYLDIGCVGTGFLVSSPERVRFRNAPSRARQIVKVGDTVISTVRTYLKAIYFVENDSPDLIASTGFAVLRPRDIHPGLFGYLLQSSSFIDQVSANSIGASYPAIPETHLRALPVAAPVDREEQIKTFEFIRKGTSNVDSTIENIRQGISYIREYRERLINDVVTGKLDVRAADSGAIAPGPCYTPKFP